MKPMKFTNLFFFISLFFVSCHDSATKKTEMFSGYKFITNFSKKIKPTSSLVLWCYGINLDLPKGYELKNEVATLSADYALYKTQKDTISLEQARKMIVSLVESILKDINSNSEIKDKLETNPFTYHSIDTSIYFQDENKIELGSGVSRVYFSKGKLTYEGYNIYEYTGQYPAHGKHFTIHKETYEEALNIVQESGEVTLF